MLFQFIKDVYTDAMSIILPQQPVRKVTFDDTVNNSPVDILVNQRMERSLDVCDDEPRNIQYANQNEDVIKKTQGRNQYNYYCVLCSQYISGSTYMYLDNPYCSINCRKQQFYLDRT
jgi:hypothetical protein